MSSPKSISSGALTTNGVVVGSQGVLTYVEASVGSVSLYEGSTSGKLITTVPSSSYRAFTTPVQFGSTGLYITVSTTATVGVVHTA